MSIIRRAPLEVVCLILAAEVAVAAHFLHAVPPGASLTVQGSDTCLARTIEVASDSASRRKGLLGRDHLADSHGFVIAPSQGIHTFGMRFPIDVVAVARDGTVIKIRRNVAPHRVFLSLRAFAIVELAAGSTERVALALGDRLCVREIT